MHGAALLARPGTAIAQLVVGTRESGAEEEKAMKANWITAGILALGPLALPATSHAAVRVGIAVALPGHNDSRYDSRYESRYDSRGSWRLEYDRGYREGAIQGSRDGRHGFRYDVRRQRDYRGDDEGYRWGGGWGGRYSQAYQRGFEEGYRRGYHSRASNRYDRYDDDRYDGRGRVIREEPYDRR